MLAISAHTRAKAVANAAATINVPLPPAFLKKVDQAEAFTDAAKQTVCTDSKLHAAVLVAIEEGRDYHADERIQRLALDCQLTSQNILAAARIRSEELVTAALKDHADDILGSWADALDEHSARLVAAAEAGLNLNDAAGAVARGGDNMQHLHAAQIAVKAWGVAIHGFGTLAAVGGVTLSPRTAPLVLTPARKTELVPAVDMAREARTDVDVWTLTRCGIVLRLCASLGEFRERAAHFKADTEAEARDHAARAKAAGFNR
ncbi:aldehyde dehydrogenase [Mycolicibacterium celeriflavum]|uniref:aldehyde dehydrogenase n=1 Tax=Mycolicibacterium celeriflavum TaxID=1249101 RepID=UPI003CF780C6